MSGLPSAPPFGAVPPSYGGQPWASNYPSNGTGQSQPMSSFPQQQPQMPHPYAMQNQPFIPGLNAQPPQPFVPPPPFPYHGAPLPFHPPPIPTGPAAHQNFHQHPSPFMPPVSSLPLPPPVPNTSMANMPPVPTGPAVPTGPRRSQPSRRPYGNNNIKLNKSAKQKSVAQAKNVEEREEGELTGDDEYDRMDIDEPSLPLPSRHQHTGNKNNNTTAITGQHRPLSPRTQLKTEAQEALRSLYAQNIRFEDLAQEGLNPTVLRRLYESAGLEISSHSETTSPFNPPAAPKAFLKSTPTVLTAKPQSSPTQKASIPANPAATAAADKTVLPSIEPATTSGDAKPMERKDVIARMLALKAKKSTNSPEETSASPSEPATKEQKAQSQPPVGDTSPAQSPPPPKDSKGKEVNKAQTELARQRIEQLRQKALRTKSNGAATTEGATAPTPATATVTEKPDQMPPPTSSLPATQLPLRPASISRETPPTSAPAPITRIPGLSLIADNAPVPPVANIEPDTIPASAPDTSLPPKPPIVASTSIQKPAEVSTDVASTPAPPPTTTASTASVSEAPVSASASVTAGQVTRKRPRAVDFDEEVSEVPAKRTVGFSPHMNLPQYEPRVIIDISDDDDFEDGLDYGDNDASTDSWNKGSSRASAVAYGSYRDMRSPYSEFGANGNALGASARSSPMSGIGSGSGSGARSGKPLPVSETHMKELMELKKKIAELEEKKKKKAKLSVSGESTPSVSVAEKQSAALPPSARDESVQSQGHAAPESSVAASSESRVTAVAATTTTAAASPSLTATNTASDTSAASRASSIPRNADDYRKSILRKKVITSGLTALKSRIAERERRREEIRRQEEALAAELEREHAREMRLMEELQALEQANAAKEQDAVGVDSTVSESTADAKEQPSEDKAPETETLNPSERQAESESQEALSEPQVAPSTVDSSAVDDLIRETRPSESVDVQAVPAAAKEEKADLEDEPMEESSSSGESSAMDESASVESSGSKKSQDNQGVEPHSEGDSEREGSYSPPEDVQDIHSSVAGADVEIADQAETKNEEPPVEESKIEEHVPESSRPDIDMQEASSDSEEYQPAETQASSEDVEMQDADAASDGYEPTDIVPEATRADEPENDHYEPPEPEIVTEKSHMIGLGVALPQVPVQAQQQPPAADEMDLDARRETLDELTYTQQSTPTIPAVADKQESETSYKPKYFTKYVTPLRFFQSYRYHPDYLKNVAGGFRSLTYSNQINPDNELCAFELAGGVCNDKTCRYQHLEDLALSDENVLLQLGQHREGRTPEEKEQYVAGLKATITEMRKNGVKDFETVAKEITAYRRRFLQDDTRVLTL